MNGIFQNVPTGKSSFLPVDYITRKTEARANILLLSLFVVVMASVCTAFLVTHRAWTELGVREAAVDDQFAAEEKKIDLIKDLEKQRAAIMEKAEITAALVEKIPRWALVGDIVLRMPKDMRLEQFALKGKRIDPPPPPPPPPGSKPLQVRTLSGSQAPGSVIEERPRVMPPQFEYSLVMTGAADQNNDVADFLLALKSSPVLQHVELQFIKESKEKDKVFRKFEINAALTTSPDTEKIAATLKDLVRKQALAAKEGKDAKAGGGKIDVKAGGIKSGKNAGAAGGKEGE